ncbi:MAG: hypothetical protein JWM99_1183, partial [Verrucomicrobiales bacterium]|nr:hypothetical protein [Verrucomicrobiales bacterium]
RSDENIWRWRAQHKTQNIGDLSKFSDGILARQPEKEGESFPDWKPLFELDFNYPLRKLLIINGAGEGNRTLVSALGRPHSTIEPHPLRI